MTALTEDVASSSQPSSNGDALYRFSSKALLGIVWTSSLIFGL